MKTKRVLFYVTVILMVLMPFMVSNIIDNGVTTEFINYISCFFVSFGATVTMLYGSSKDEIKNITGLTMFDEE